MWYFVKVVLRDANWNPEETIRSRICLIMVFMFSSLIVGMFLHYWETLQENFTDNNFFFCSFICKENFLIAL